MKNRYRAMSLGLICLFSLSLVSAQNLQGKRVALVIGNSSYSGEDRLQNPANDANDIADALGKAGFQVSLRVDQNLDGMMAAVEEFTMNSMKGAQTAVFFFAGHGLQVKGENYLIPVDLKLEGLSETMLPKKTQSVQEVLAMMEEARVPMSILILDACRTNPYGSRGGTRSVPGERGFAEMSVPRGSYILFASEPGKPALDNSSQRNGAFTGTLLKHMLTPGLEFSNLVKQVSRDLNASTSGKQVPYPSGILLDDFYLVPKLQAPETRISASSSQATTLGRPVPVNPSPDSGNGKAGVSSQATSLAPSGPEGSHVSVKPEGAGEIVVVTDPEGAEIFVQGRKAGIAGDLIEVPAGTELEIEAKAGGFAGTAKIKLNPGDLKSIELKLEREKGNLVIKASGAQGMKLLVDSAEFGAYAAGGIFKGITAGKHTFELSGNGLYWAGDAEISPNKTTTIGANFIEVGSIKLTIPPNVTVKLSGSSIQKTLSSSTTLSLIPAGAYTLTASGTGYETSKLSIVLRRGEEYSYKPWASGFLSVETEPPGAAIYVDGVSRGKSPLTVEATDR